MLRLCKEWGDYDAAEVLLREALALRPGAIASRLALAALLEQLGRRDEALLEYARCIDLAPDDGAVYIAYAQALYSHGLADEAVTQLRAALSVAPNLGTLPELIARMNHEPARVLPADRDSASPGAMVSAEAFRQSGGPSIATAEIPADAPSLVHMSAPGLAGTVLWQEGIQEGSAAGSRRQHPH